MDLAEDELDFLADLHLLRGDPDNLQMNPCAFHFGDRDDRGRVGRREEEVERVRCSTLAFLQSRTFPPDGRLFRSWRPSVCVSPRCSFACVLRAVCHSCRAASCSQELILSALCLCSFREMRIARADARQVGVRQRKADEKIAEAKLKAK